MILKCPILKKRVRRIKTSSTWPYIEDYNILLIFHRWHLILPEVKHPVVAIPHLCQILGKNWIRRGGGQRQVSEYITYQKQENETPHGFFIQCKCRIDLNMKESSYISHAFKKAPLNEPEDPILIDYNGIKYAYENEWLETTCSSRCGTQSYMT